MSVSVVIPVYNQSHFTRRCLESLLNHSRQVAEVFVVDNASSDDTAVVLEGFFNAFAAKKIKYSVITNTENRGFGRACNQGLREMTGDFLVVLNNDTWLMPDWDEVLVSRSRELKLACIGPYFYEGPFESEAQLLLRAEQFTRKNQNGVRHHFVPILMCFTRPAYLQLRFDHGGLFDERFFVTCEDTDLKIRMQQQGLRYAQTGACFIWHHSMGTRGDISLLPSPYLVEGLRLFQEKWGFDARAADHTFWAKLRRKWWKMKDKVGVF